MAKANRLARLLTVLGVVVMTIGCDRITKQAAERHLAGRPGLSLADDVIRLEYAENRGGFLSIGADLPAPVRAVVFGFGAALALACVGVWAARRAAGGGFVLGPALLWAGGIANLADRIARESVVDFLNLGLGSLRTGIFNVADVAITVGIVLVAIDLGRARARR